jgi:hypothetical protein
MYGRLQAARRTGECECECECVCVCARGGWGWGGGGAAKPARLPSAEKQWLASALAAWYGVVSYYGVTSNGERRGAP